MSNYIHQQNCTVCDKPGWLIGGYLYNILRLTVNDVEKEHRVIVEFRFHKCEVVKDLHKETKKCP